jgi:hypothetical protein
VLRSHHHNGVRVPVASWFRLLALSSCNLVADRIPHEVSGSSAIKLAHNVPAVRLYSLAAYAKQLADCFACIPFGHEL